MATQTLTDELNAKKATYGRIEFLDLKLLNANPWQPRTSMDDAELEDLADSIYTQGLLQPPVARPSPDGASTYQLAFGHRRVAAIRLLVKQGRWNGDVHVSVQDLTDEEMALLALAENSHRKDLTPIEEYRSYARILEEISELTIQKLADSVGIGRPTLSNNLRILKLPKVVLERVEAGEMSVHAAREFLCLQNDDHTHEREMAVAINDIARTEGVDGAPDWRVKNVRSEIRDAVMRHDPDWRPLAESKGDVDVGYFNSAARREPSFDVAEYMKANQGELHTVPRADDKSRLWTCNPKAWRRAQSAVTRATTKDESSDKKEERATPDRSFPTVLASDPLLKSIRAAAKKAGEEVGKKGSLTEKEVEELGTRAKLNGRRSYDHIELAANLGDGRIPVYFPDLDECRQRCNFGATYGQDWQGSAITLRCMNQQHFKEKVAAGKKAYEEELAAAKKLADVSDGRLAAVLETKLTDGPTAAVIATALCRGLDFKPISPEAGYQFAYYPRVLTKAVGRLNIEIRETGFGQPSIDPDEAVKAIGRIQDDSDVRELASNLVVWALRAGSKNGELDVDALTEFVTASGG